MDTQTWLDTDYVQRILRKAGKDESIQVSSITVKPATAKGDNYTSDMHRVSAVLTRIMKGHNVTETKSFIAKIAPQGARGEMISKARYFETEMAVMSETLPLMNNLLAEVGTTPLAAQCLHVQYQDPVHLIIEDLTPEAFRMADRLAGLDLDHCLLAIRNLAIFHASSVALTEKNPEAVTKYKEGIFHKNRPSTLTAMFKLGTQTLAKQVAEWSELSPRIAEKILNLSETIYEKGCEAALFREEDFNVLNHGDFWINNMLFQYDNQQKPVGYRFVDFQVCHYGSPAVDILFFFGTSPSDEIRMHYREFILREYHVTLTGTMAKLECSTEAPNFDTLQEMLRKRALYEVVVAFTLLPLVLVDKSKVKSLDDLASSDKKYDRPAYEGKSYRKVITRLLPLYDGMGLLDV
ncbi:uncharacterized protein LOC124413404 [Diprion similis]|uniref:uncharacterized protein LOC124413404 n=1 Tax=Diprion similis TaxID=362088 RepID=UPI001EF77184|nr:uncharacterized protein LOC124413404 [Diprion similis]